MLELSEFSQHSGEVVEQLKASGTPLVLTVERTAEVVVQDLASYRRLVEAAERSDAIAAISQGLEDIRAGNGRPYEDVLQDLRRKYDIPG
jgi:hypothetical protein